MKGRAKKTYRTLSDSGEKGHMMFAKSKRQEGGLTLKKVHQHKVKHSKEDLAKAHMHMKKHGG